MKITVIVLITLVFSCNIIVAQQLPDTLYSPKLVTKEYPNNDGTKIYIDEGHKNLHTLDGGFLPTARLLELDGYRVEGFDTTFSDNTLKGIDVLLIANAGTPNTDHPIVRPTESAFTDDEIKSLNKWVTQGGSLFLIADHMPFAGAAESLADEFGFKFYDGFLMNEDNGGTIDFSRTNKLLTDNFITNGRAEGENVNSVRSFTGQGFNIPPNAISILNSQKEHLLYLTDTIWVFSSAKVIISGEDLSQGAIQEFGKGKLAFFGEAAMFTAQLAGPEGIRVGMNSTEAKENYQLLLNIIHWLDDRYLEED